MVFKTKILKEIVLLLIFVFSILPSFGQQVCENKIINGGFEDPSIMNSMTNNAWGVYGGAMDLPFYDSAPPIPGWDPQSPYQVELQNGTLLYGQASFMGLQHAEIDAVGKTFLRQTIMALEPGAYVIEVYYSRRPGIKGKQELAVMWNGKVIALITQDERSQNLNWRRYSFLVAVEDSLADNVIGFESRGPKNGAGNLIDEVSVYPFTCLCEDITPKPLPSPVTSPPPSQVVTPTSSSPVTSPTSEASTSPTSTGGSQNNETQISSGQPEPLGAIPPIVLPSIDAVPSTVVPTDFVPLPI